MFLIRSTTRLKLLSSHRSVLPSTSHALSRCISGDTNGNLLEVLPTNESSPLLSKIRHSGAHVLAMAVQKLYKNAKCTIGPVVDNGFYYDFDIPDRGLSDDDLGKIKKEMVKIINRKLPFRREEVTREEAKSRILAAQEPFKLEILDSIKTEPITIYHIGDKWWDLCAGPHVENTSEIPADAISLDSVSGAYWRGDEKNAKLQRVYGTAFLTSNQLQIYHDRIAEAKKRDHRLLGKQLDLFSIQEDAGGGLVFWHAKGAIVRRAIEDFWKDVHVSYGYDFLHTPHIANLDLWKTSGHCDFYKDDMFKTIDVDNSEYQLKPMNCPFHCLVFKDRLKSYRDLPVRYAELGTVYRYERSGALHGLFRVRGFTQDDGHIFCLPEQLEREIVGVLDLTENLLGKFGFTEFEVMLSTRPKDSVGSDEIWSKSTAALTNALATKGWKYSVDEGGGAFYGPKIDIKIRDAIGRHWQCSTIQCDFNLPERFDLSYVTKSQGKERPIMIHRAIFGSLERFMGVLTESTAGEFPFWLSPAHIRLLPVTDACRDYCEEVGRAARLLGLRVEVDSSNGRIANQIRMAQQEKVPIVAIIGTKEVESRSLSLRLRKIGDVGNGSFSSILDYCSELVKNKNAVDIDKLKSILTPVPTEANTNAGASEENL